MNQVNWIKRKIAKWINLKGIELVKESPWVVVYQSTDEYSVRIFQNLLESNDIKTIVFNQQDSSYKAFGYYYLQVLKEDEDRASKLLNLPNE